MKKLFKKKQDDSIEKQIDSVSSKYANFSDSYETRKILYDLGFTTDFVEGLYDYGYFSTKDFDAWFKKYDNIIAKNSKIYKLLKTTYLGGLENFKMNQEFDEMAKK